MHSNWHLSVLVAFAVCLTSCDQAITSKPRILDKEPLIGCYRSLEVEGELEFTDTKILYNDHVIYSSYKFGIFGRNPVPHIYASPRVLPYIAERSLEFRRQPVYSGSITIFVSPIEKDTGYSILLTEMDYGQRLKFEKTSCDDREFFGDRDL